MRRHRNKPEVIDIDTDDERLNIVVVEKDVEDKDEKIMMMDRKRKGGYQLAREDKKMRHNGKNQGLDQDYQVAGSSRRNRSIEIVEERLSTKWDRIRNQREQLDLMFGAERARMISKEGQENNRKDK